MTSDHTARPSSTDVADTLSGVAALYSANLAQHGAAAAAVGWNSATSQRLRFEKLSHIIAERASPITVNDYGCGYGAHLAYLTEELQLSVQSYFGYDLSQPMLDAAKATHATFAGALSLQRSAVVNTIADYSFVSGTFNVRFASDDATWAEHIARTLDMLNAHSTRGFAFNLLSTYVDWKQPDLYYADPCYWFDHCKRHYSRQVTLLHDYPLFEWTMLVTKPHV